MLSPVQVVEPQENRKQWQADEIADLFALPFNDLIFQAASIHRQHFDPNEVQISTLLSIKTGACPEDCKYCSQSVHNHTGLEREKLLAVKKVVERSEEHTSELSHVRISYAVFCLKKKKKKKK